MLFTDDSRTRIAEKQMDVAHVLSLLINENEIDNTRRLVSNFVDDDQIYLRYL